MTIHKTRLSLAIATALGITGGSLGITLPAYATNDTTNATVRELKAQLELLQSRIEELERQQAQEAEIRGREQQIETPEAPRTVTGGDRPGTFKLPGADTSVKIGGYVKLDAIYDFNEDLGDTLFPGAVVTDPDAEVAEGHTRFHARQSRLFISTWTPTRLGELNTHWEGDFFGGGGNEVFSNSSSFRIRHAYGELGGLLAGQTWTNFFHFAYQPVATVDFGGPMGVPFIRQGQVRYTYAINDNTKLSVALENPEGTGYENANDPVPDITAALRWGTGPLNLEAGLVGRYLEFDDGINDDSEFGYGISFGGNYTIGNTTLAAGGQYGDGIGRYIYLADGSRVGAAFIDDNGNLETIEAHGFTAALQHQWTPTVKTGLVYGRTAGDRPDPTAIDQLETIHANVFWTPVPRAVFGFEYSWAAQELQNGDDGDANRIQFSALYNF